MQINGLSWKRGVACLCGCALLPILMGGCPPTVTPDDNSNDNGSGQPIPDVVVNVVVEGEGAVTQDANGAEVTLMAVADAGWRFDGWTGSVDSQENPLTITATEETALRARFVEILQDADGDEVADAGDNCPGTATGATVDANGCATSQIDTDTDGVFNDVDQCPDTAAGENVDSNGCPSTDPDSDGDGVANAEDDCPGTPSGATVNADGCAPTQLDSDGDQVNDERDRCPQTATGASVDANGCAPAQRDADGDGVNDTADQCANTPRGTAVGADGCPSTTDSDGDGVPNAQDQCADTTPGRQVDANGCPVPTPGGGGGGGGGGGTPGDADGDGVTDDLDQCADTPSNQTVDANGCPDVCGRASGGCFTVHASPGCMDPVCCSMVCSQDAFCCDSDNQWDETCVEEAQQLCSGAPPLPDNNACAAPQTVTDGTTRFSNDGATTDGPNELQLCGSEPAFRIGADVWFSYSATCTGEVIVSLCGSRFDTTLAVYNGSTCPTEAAIGCSDDGCLVLESRATVPVTQGQAYLIRVGGYSDPVTGQSTRGSGDLTIICGDNDVCGPGNGDCMAAHDSRGCDVETCCNQVCEADPTCCDVTWDDVCAQEAAGLCGGSFASCGADGAGACNQAGETPGCATATCCNAVCQDDPYCCIASWDQTCVSAAAANAACQ